MMRPSRSKRKSILGKIPSNAHKSLKNRIERKLNYYNQCKELDNKKIEDSNTCLYMRMGNPGTLWNI